MDSFTTARRFRWLIFRPAARTCSCKATSQVSVCQFSGTYCKPDLLDKGLPFLNSLTGIVMKKFSLEPMSICQLGPFSRKIIIFSMSRVIARNVGLTTLWQVLEILVLLLSGKLRFARPLYFPAQCGFLKWHSSFVISKENSSFGFFDIAKFITILSWIPYGTV